MLKSIRNSLLLTSALYIAVGATLIIYPSTALKTACLVLGAVTLIYGVVRIVSYCREGDFGTRFDLFVGVVCAALGAFLLVCPQFFVEVLPAVISVVLGVYIVIDSVTAIKKALDMRALGFEKWWISFLAAVLLAAFGVVLVLRPFATVPTLVTFIGAGFVFDGIYTLVNTLVASRVFKE